MSAPARKVIPILLATMFCVVGVLPHGAASRCAALELQFDITDEDVDKAMERLINFLSVCQRDDGSWEDVVGSHWKRKIGGTTALATLALLEAGVKLNDPRMEKALAALMAAKMDDTYCYAVRVMALSQAYRLAQRKEFETQIIKDLQWLTTNLPMAGAWDYGGPRPAGDNSCSQFGLLALWEAEWAGFDASKKITPGAVSVPLPPKPAPPTPPRAPGQQGAAAGPAVAEEFDPAKAWPVVLRNLANSWRTIEKRWVERHRPDNGWTYAAVAGPEVESTMTMTAAGIASLYIVIDEIYAPRMTPGRPRPQTSVFDKADAGMEWLAKRLTPAFTHDGYLAFGIQRIALASGHKYIGEHDWFRLGVKEISSRASDARKGYGGQYGNDVQAAFYLLFLARGRVPVTFNKLERPGTDWDCAPRDIANLTRYLITQLEQRMAWQIVNVDRPVGEFLDAPILFINGIQPLKLTSETVRKIREYVLRGGLVLGEATNASVPFADSFKAMMQEAFPEGKKEGAASYVWYKMPLEHPILQKLDSKRDQDFLGPLWAMDDGTRTVAVLLPRDHATAWQHMDVPKAPHSFTLGLNLFKYASAEEPLRTRLRPVFVGRQRKADVAKQIGLMHVGDPWLSENYAIERLSDKLTVKGRIMIDPVQATNPAELNPRECPMIWFTGRGSHEPTDTTIEALRKYVEKGGLVAINANMGDLRFAASAKALAKRLLPDAEPVQIDDTDPIFTGMVYRERGESLADPGFRHALKSAGVRKIDLIGYRTGNRWGVIVSPHDVFLPLLGTPIWGCKGYTTETAHKIAANIYLYALEQAEKGVETPKT